MKRIVTIVSATGLVIDEWAGGDDQELPTAEGGTEYIDVSGAPGADYRQQHWTGTEWEPRTFPEFTIMTRLQFRDLFTPAERLAIRELAVDDLDPEVIDANEALGLAEYVDRADARVAMYLLMLVSKGALTMERRDEILAGSAPA